jgi:hypothetical protein
MHSILSTFLLLGALSISSLSAARSHPEKYYQESYADKIGGETEVRAADGTRVDILTDVHAIEVDFGDKWAEAVGQSLYYAFQFNRKAGIVLILEDASDYKYLIRLNSVIEQFDLPIDVLEITNYDEE